MRRHSEAGIIGWAILAIFVCGVVFAACIAAGHKDDDSLGRIRLVSHERCDPEYDDCGDDGRQKRTCFFGCDNIIIVPGLPGMGGDQPPPPEERVSLVPPTPDKIIQGIQVMTDAGINLGTTIARLVVDYVVTVFRFIV